MRAAAQKSVPAAGSRGNSRPLLRKEERIPVATGVHPSNLKENARVLDVRLLRGFPAADPQPERLEQNEGDDGRALRCVPAQAASQPAVRVPRVRPLLRADRDNEKHSGRGGGVAFGGRRGGPVGLCQVFEGDEFELLRGAARADLLGQQGEDHAPLPHGRAVQDQGLSEDELAAEGRPQQPLLRPALQV